MNLFKMKGHWGNLTATIYDIVVAEGLSDLYDLIIQTFFKELPGGSSVLDLGCGSGQIANKIARLNPGIEVLGMDLSESQILRAKKRGNGISNLRFCTGDAMKLDLNDSVFNSVISCASIKHWPNPKRGIEEMLRVCRPGGTIYIFEVDKEADWNSAKGFVSRWNLLVPWERPLITLYFKLFVSAQRLTDTGLLSLMKDVGIENPNVQRIVEHPVVIGIGKKPKSYK